MRSLTCAALLLVACGGDDTVDPSEATESDFYGIWTSDVTPGAPGTGISFHERGMFHPSLEGARNVYAMYGHTPNTQFLDEVGTYRVDGGVLYRTAVWKDRELSGSSEVGAKIYAITRNGALSLETNNPSVPMDNYNAVDGCRVPTLEDGWSTRTMQRATYLGRNQVTGNPASVQFFDGAMIGTSHNAVFAYHDDDCVPEIDGADLVGGTILSPTAGGMHALVGQGVGDARMAKYAKLTSSRMPMPAPQEIPVLAREMIDWSDVGGTLMVLANAAAPTLVRADGITLALPADAPASFAPQALVDLGGHPALVGIGYTPAAALWLLAYTGSGWTQTEVPGTRNPAYVNATTRGDDVYIVSSISGDNGGKPRILFLVRRIGGTWLPPLAIGAGTEPQILVDDAGVVHVTSRFEHSQIEDSGHYARIDGTTVTAWTVSPGFVHDPFAAIAPPMPALGADGSVSIGFVSDIRTKRPGDRDSRMVPLSIEIEGTGRVTSSDGTVDCAQTCTVQVEAGRAMVLHAEPRPTLSPHSYDTNTFDYVFRAAGVESIDSVSFRF